MQFTGLGMRIALGAMAAAVALAPGQRGAADPPTSDEPARPHSAGGCHFYQDGRVTWSSWSWGAEVGTADMAAAPFDERPLAVTFERGWAGLGFSSSAIPASPYSHLRFKLLPSGGGFPAIRAALIGSDGVIWDIDAGPYAATAGGGWHEVSIPLADLGAADVDIRGLQVREASGRSVPTFYLAGVRLGGTGEAAYPPCPFRPLQASEEVDKAIHDAAERYNLPRWFYYAIIQRESSFNPDAVGPKNDLGLTQLYGIKYTGQPYPMDLSEPDDLHQAYFWDLNFRDFGRWVSMEAVSELTDPFDPAQNLDRFSTGYAVPAFHLFKEVYGLDDEETLRAVAYHWNKGLFRTYDPADSSYLGLYDRYVAEFRPPVEDEDGAWNGRPALPGR